MMSKDGFPKDQNDVNWLLTANWLATSQWKAIALVYNVGKSTINGTVLMPSMRGLREHRRQDSVNYVNSWCAELTVAGESEARTHSHGVQGMLP